MVDYDEIKKIVLLRLESMSPDIRVSIGSNKDLTKQDLIKEVNSDTDLGKLIVKMQLEYLRSMKKGLT